MTHCREAVVGDVDNLIRPIQDALQGVVYWHDRQVSDTVGNRRRIDASYVVRGVGLMALPTDAVIEKKRQSVAQEYRRQGYRVTVPERSAALPSFLRDCLPDLIERDDDHVAIEIRHSNMLRGSNDLKELAARVATQPGWRFELVTLGNDGNEADVISRPDWLESMLRTPDLATNPDQAYFHVVYLGQVLEFLVRGVALRNGIRIRDRLPRRIANELVFAGIMEQPILDRLEHALSYRDKLLHERVAPENQKEQVHEMTALSRDIYRQCVSEADENSAEA
jgi:REase_AHJR-like protein